MTITLESPDDSGIVSARLWEAGTLGLEEFDLGLRAYFDDSIEPAMVRQLFPTCRVQIEAGVPAVAVREAADRDPILVGKRFVIVPTGRIPLAIDAGMAFGSGRHETTQLCLEALEELVNPGATVFDVGCGSGILALACQKLGAGEVVGADIDEAAIGVARQHVSAPLFVGSADGFPNGRADLVICNITAKVCDRLATDLKRITKEGGRVLISGFTTELRPERFKAEQLRQLNDWECWICDPALIKADPAAMAEGEHARQWWL